MSNYEDPSTDFFGQGHLTTSSSASRLSSGEFKFHSSFRTTETILSNLIGGSSSSSSPSSSGVGGGAGSSNSNFVVVSSSSNNNNCSNNFNNNNSSFGGVGLANVVQMSATSHQGFPFFERGNSSGSIELSAAPTAGGNTPHNTPLPHSPTPPIQRRLAKSFSVAPSITEKTKG